MAARRFDTDTLLKQLLENKEDAFMPFYDRYCGRVYRFIARQCGNGEEGQAAYVAIWAQFIHARLNSKDPKALKLAFFSSLERPNFTPPIKSKVVVPHNLMPKELEQEGGWSTLMVELIRRLPDGLRKRFLFRYEIGLSLKAIATVFEERTETTKAHVEEAERILIEGLVDSGWKRTKSLVSLYRETRLLKPPSSWNHEVLLSYSGWMKKGAPKSLLELFKNNESKTKLASMKSFFKKTVDQLRNEVASKTKAGHQSTP